MFRRLARGAPALALMIALLVPSRRAYAGAVGDSSAAAGTAQRTGAERRTRAAEADSARASGTPVATPWPEQPRFVMLRSLVIPGWGQLHNHAWAKAAGVAGAEGVLVSKLIADQHELDRLNQAYSDAQQANDQAEATRALNAYNDRLDQNVGHQWWLAGVVVYALLDAYVDAHFKNFEIEFRTDPALPGGVPPGAQRLQLRWNF